MDSLRASSTSSITLESYSCSMSVALTTGLESPIAAICDKLCNYYLNLRMKAQTNQGLFPKLRFFFNSVFSTDIFIWSFIVRFIISCAKVFYALVADPWRLDALENSLKMFRYLFIKLLSFYALIVSIFYLRGLLSPKAPAFYGEVF